MAEEPVGKITHFFDKIGVAVVELSGVLKVGDRIKVSGSNEFEQTVASMQIEKQQVERAGAGQSIGLKVAGEVRKGDLVFKA
ncbi:MAG: EF-Tu/IF-2/RF-3 family GTPase [Candidatus Micrarchaeota archaeon]